ncbi:hypothetical protein Hypma_016484 [Hypsizygus marmoreus]|uniref:Fungal calcium binding protein domain-containing protein n=1 Tax=Hypsizygus marmoreus TaxID=39966 RepID=A0A369IYU1_HYPMA|nr:hypothetical protein Hypma_016484 [Hypsizygus marmoreus]
MPSFNTILLLALFGAFIALAAPLNECQLLGVRVVDPSADLQALLDTNAACTDPPTQLAYLENQLRLCIISQGGTPPDCPAAAANTADPGNNNVAAAAIAALVNPGISAVSNVLGGVGLVRRAC